MVGCKSSLTPFDPCIAHFWPTGVGPMVASSMRQPEVTDESRRYRNKGRKYPYGRRACDVKQVFPPLGVLAALLVEHQIRSLSRSSEGLPCQLRLPSEFVFDGSQWWKQSSRNWSWWQSSPRSGKWHAKSRHASSQPPDAEAVVHCTL